MLEPSSKTRKQIASRCSNSNSYADFQQVMDINETIDLGNGQRSCLNGRWNSQFRSHVTAPDGQCEPNGQRRSTLDLLLGCTSTPLRYEEQEHFMTGQGGVPQGTGWDSTNYPDKMTQERKDDHFTGVLWPMPSTPMANRASPSNTQASKAIESQPGQKRSSVDQDPSLATNEDATNLSSTACRRCRSQKLRCTRELEGCRRCQRQKISCSYPPPPDRKLLNAIKRSESSARKDHQVEVRNEAIAAALDPEQSSLKPRGQAEQFILTPDSRTAYSHGTHISRTSLSQDQDLEGSSAALPPRTLGFSLLELYWSHFYKSALLFYKPQLFNDYMEGRLPDYLLRSLFAVASLLLVPPDEAPPNCSIEPSELLALAPFRARGRAWFDSALRDALLLAVTDLSLHVCQSLSSLMMFAFQTGEAHYTDMILTLNYRCCTALQREKLDESSLEAELTRRVLWEAWSCYCVAGDPKYLVRSSWSEVADLPLPAVLNRSGYEGLEIVLNEAMDEEWHGHPCSANSRPPGRGEGMPFYASYLKLIGIWSKVQLFASEASTFTFESRLDRIAQLSTLCDEVHDSDWSPRYFDPQEAVDQSERLDVRIASEAMYRLCEMVIHSAIVPRFTGRLNPASAPVETIQAAAERVVANATALAEMFERYHQQQVDLSITVGIAGYSAFIAGCALAIYSCTRPRDDPALPAIRTHVVAVLNLLNIMDRYWKVLVGPHRKLKDAAEHYGLVECASGAGPAAAQHVEDARFDRTPAVGAKLRVLAPGYVYKTAPGRPSEHLYGAHMTGTGSQPGTRQHSPTTPARMEPAEQVEAAQAQQLPVTPAVMTPSFDPAFGSFPMDWWNIPSPKAMGGNGGMFDQLDSLGFVFDQGWT